MTRARRGAKILGLALLAALCAMALTAVAAQAAGELKVEGKTLAESEEATLEGTGGKGKLLEPSLGVEIECTSAAAKVKGKNVKSMGHFHGTVHVLFAGCKVVGNSFCKIYPTEADRTAKTNVELILASALVLVKTVALEGGVSDYLVLAEQLLGTPRPPLTTLYLTKAGGCTLGANKTLTGTAAFKVLSANTEAKEHTLGDITEKEEKELGVSLSFGAEPVTLDEGNTTGHLAEPFLNKAFSLT